MWIRIRKTAQKWVALLVSVLVMLAFALILNSGQMLKRPQGTADDIPGGLVRLESSVDREDWAAAATELEALAHAMSAVRPRIELASELSELNRFSETLALLRGSIRARDRSASLQQTALLALLYDDLGR